MGEIRIYRPAARAKKGAAKGPIAKLGISGSSQPLEIAAAIRQGFPVEVIDRLREELTASQQTILKLTHISGATLMRRRATARKGTATEKGVVARLTPEESDRVYRIAAVLESAVQLFEGDEEAARRWLKEPAKALGGSAPLDHLDTEAGAYAVQDLIGRLEHGVYS